MNYFKLLLCTLITFASTSFAMEQATHPAGRSPLEQLPTSVQGLILEELAKSKTRIPYCELDHGHISWCKLCDNHNCYQGLEKWKQRRAAIRSVQNLTSVSKTLSGLRNDRDICGDAVKALAANHFDANIPQAALALPTAGTQRWLLEKANAEAPYLYLAQKKEKIVFLLKSFPNLLNQRFHTRKGHTMHGAQPDYIGTILTEIIQSLNNTIDIDSIMELESRYRQTLDESQRNATPRLIDIPDSDGLTPLMVAIKQFERKQYPISNVSKILEYDPNIYATDLQGRTAFHGLVASNATDHTNQPMRDSFYESRNAAVATILQRDYTKALINQKDNDGDTPLIAAVKATRYISLQANLELLKKLIEVGADVMAKNHDGNTMLNQYVKSHNEFNSEDIKNILMLIPADKRAKLLNEPDLKGNTPFMNLFAKIICGGEKPRRWEFLLQLGADPSIKNKHNETAFDLAFNTEVFYGRFFWILESGNDIEWIKILWKYNPQNKWAIYRKYHPYRFYTGAATGLAVAGSLAWLASKYMPEQIQTDAVQ